MTTRPAEIGDHGVVLGLERHGSITSVILQVVPRIREPASPLTKPVTIPPPFFSAMAFTMTMSLFGDERFSPSHPEYLRVAAAAAQLATAEWLQGIDAERLYLFEIEGVECALECCTGHWGTDARWRWGRTAAGDPDEDDSGGDILLDVALGRQIVLERQKAGQQSSLPPYAEGDLAEDEIKSCALARARENLGKLVLHPVG